MPAERLSMRKIREVLRLKYACGASDRVISRSLGIGRTAVAEYVRYYRFKRKHSSIDYLTPTQFATSTMTPK